MAGLLPAVDAALEIGPEETPGDESDGTDAPRRVTMMAFTDTGRQLLAALAPLTDA